MVARFARTIGRIALALLIGASAAYATESEAGPVSQEQISALLRLGDMYYMQGQSTDRDLAKAFAFYEQAAAAGSAAAKLRVGEMLARGQGVSQDISAGRRMVAEVASLGDADGLLLFGDLLAGADGGPTDRSAAIAAYEKAAAQGSTRAFISLGDLYLRMDNGVIDSRAAIEVYQRSTDNGSVEAMLKLGDLFYEGEYLPSDLSKAYRYYSDAAEGGSGSGRLHAAEMLAHGHGIPQDIEAGRALLTELAASGDAGALVALGDAYSRGDAGPILANSAIQAYLKAAAAGRTQALMRLGDLYCAGTIVRADCRKALRYYQQAADAGDRYAFYAIGSGYIKDRFSGAGSPAEGIDLLRKAEQLGVEEAVIAIAEYYLHSDRKKKRDVGKALAILNDALATGNIAAGRYLVALYREGGRDGRVTTVPPNQTRARGYLARIQESLSPSALELEEILFDLADDSGRTYEKLYEYLKSLSPRGKGDLLRDLSRSHPNAYVALIQIEFAKEGLYDGPATGLLDGRTARAVSRYCAQREAAQICRFGPMSGATAQLISSAF